MADAQEPISDNELFASYCFGVFQQREVERQKALSYPCNGDQTCESLQHDSLKDRAQESARMERLRQYLLIKMGTRGLSPASTAALTAVKQDGARDWAQCLSERMANLQRTPPQCSSICRESPKHNLIGVGGRGPDCKCASRNRDCKESRYRHGSLPLV